MKGVCTDTSDETTALVLTLTASEETSGSKASTVSAHEIRVVQIFVLSVVNSVSGERLLYRNRQI